MIAALYVETNGVYYGLPDVDPWDEERDARLYAGPWPVVAHPPCERWSVLAPLVEKTHGYIVGDDGGKFAAALSAVRRWGGVIEHPAFSYAWWAFDLPKPPRGMGWQYGLCGGASCYIEQWHYGHRAIKPTWLYAYGQEALPRLKWHEPPPTLTPAYVTDGGGDIKRKSGKVPDPARQRLGKREASATTPEVPDFWGFGHIISELRSDPAGGIVAKRVEHPPHMAGIVELLPAPLDRDRGNL